MKGMWSLLAQQAFVQTHRGHSAMCLVTALQPGPEDLLKAVPGTQVLQRDYCRKKKSVQL